MLFCVLSASFPTIFGQIEGLVAYYPLDGNGGDASGNGLNGAVTGTTATMDRYGNASGALLFANDTDRVNCGNPAAFNFTGAFTISAWVNLNGTRENPYIVAKYDFDINTGTSSPHSYGLGLASVPYPYGFIGGDSGFADTVAFNNPIPLNQWHALSLVYTGTNLLLYLNGSSVSARLVDPFPPFVNSVPLTIGGTSLGQVFGGAIDDVRIHSRALSTDEIAAQYQADLPPVPPTSASLVAHYDLDGNAHDKSGNGLHGTLTGTTSIADRFGKVTAALTVSTAGIRRSLTSAGISH